MSAITTTKERPILMCGEMVRATLREQNPKTQTRRTINMVFNEDLPQDHPLHSSKFKTILELRDGVLCEFMTAERIEAGEWMPGIKPDPGWVSLVEGVGPNGEGNPVRCPYGKPGDTLFVKETWRTKSQWDGLKPSDLPIANEFMVSPFIAYEADGPSRELHGKTRPSIFMPRWASRITLEIESVRVERLQDISEEDAKAEGVRFHASSKVYGEGLCFLTAKHAYAQLWESINGKGSWAQNCWVWVIAFKRI